MDNFHLDKWRGPNFIISKCVLNVNKVPSPAIFSRPQKAYQKPFAPCKFDLWIVNSVHKTRDIKTVFLVSVVTEALQCAWRVIKRKKRKNAGSSSHINAPDLYIDSLALSLSLSETCEMLCAREQWDTIQMPSGIYDAASRRGGDAYRFPN